MKSPTKILLQTTITFTEDDWHIGRFSLLGEHLASLKDENGDAHYEVTARDIEKDENLRREFEERLKDEKFAKSPRARLNFFYERSPYSDKRIGIYPVGRIVKEIK